MMPLQPDDQLCDGNAEGGGENLRASHDERENDSKLPSLANLQMPQTRQGQNENGNICENMWQADVAVARHDIGTVALNQFVPLELEGLADSEGRNDVCDGMGYAYSDDDPCADSYSATGKDPQVQD